MTMENMEPQAHSLEEEAMEEMMEEIGGGVLMQQAFEDRTIYLTGAIYDAMAQKIIKQLLELEFANPTQDIVLYINSPGGSVTDTFAIYDTMTSLRCDVVTVVTGQACSGGSILLAGGKKGKRFAYPHAEIMIHQPLGGYAGQTTDLEIYTKMMKRWKNTIVDTYHHDTGQSKEKLSNDIERDYFMTAQEAKVYGVVDHIGRPLRNFAPVEIVEPESEPKDVEYDFLQFKVGDQA